MNGAGESAWADACRAAAMLAVAPAALGGVALRAYPGPVRDSWLRCLRDCLASETPWRPVPAHVSETRLLGGLDLAASLGSGQPVFASGLLAEADGGILLLSMAERAQRFNLAHICAAMDSGQVLVERDHAE